MRSASGGLNVMIVNKDLVQSLTITIETSQPIHTATLQTLTGSNLAATTGVMIQGATVNLDGSFAPLNPATLTPAGSKTTCYVAALSAGLVSIT